MNKSNWPRLIWAVVLVTVLGTGALFAGQLGRGQVAAGPSAGGLLGPAGGNAGSGAAPAAGLIVQAAAPGQPIVSTSVRNDLSAPLASIQPLEPKQAPDNREEEERENFLPGRENAANAAPLPGGVDPLWQTGQNGVDIPRPTVNFEGVNNVNGVLPPDTEGDVGPNHYVQWVNLSFAIYDKTGVKLYGPAAGNTLWSGFGGPCQNDNDGDPIAQYDHLADRWMMSQFALPNFPSGPFHQCIAVSQTADPLGSWYRYDFIVSNTKMNDYPKFGVWPDAYYMAVNQFNQNTFTWGGQGVVAFDRSRMLSGLSATMVYFDLYARDPNLGGMLPSDLDGAVPPAGSPNTFVQMDDNAWGYSPDQVQLWKFHVDWVTPANSTFTFDKALSVASFDTNMCNYNRSCIPQPGTSRGLDAIADRLMYRLQYRNFGGYETLVTNHTVDVDGRDLAGIRWYELRNSGSGWSVYQQGTFAPRIAVHRWMASLAMDQAGNMAMVYSASYSRTLYPSVVYTGRLVTDPLGTMPQKEGLLIRGTGAQTHSASRWGDYAMMAVDSTDGCTFWMTSEYIKTTGSAPWQTRIGAFKFPSCTP